MSTPYTPSTIQRLRKLALTHSPAEIARILDWPLERVRLMARRHDIELIARRVAPMASAGDVVHGDVIWNAGARTVTRDDRGVVLTEAKAAVFAVLFAQWMVEPFEYSTRGALTRDSGFAADPHMMARLTEDLAQVWIGITSAAGKFGGYRLHLKNLTHGNVREAAE